MTEKTPQEAPLTSEELELVKRVAQRDGISVDEAATNLGRAALARRVRKKTGKGPAKVYGFKRAK